MNFIDYKQFKSASEKAQKTIMRLFENNNNSYNLIYQKPNYIGFYGDLECCEYVNYIPLLTEGQLIDMIEELNECIVDMHYEGKGYGYTIELYTNDEKMSEKHSFPYLKCNNRLEAYWKSIKYFN